MTGRGEWRVMVGEVPVINPENLEAGSGWGSNHKEEQNAKMSMLESEIKCFWFKILAASVLGKGDVFLTTSVVPTGTCAALFHRLDLTHLFNNNNVLLCVQQYVKRGHSRSTIRDHAIQIVSFYWSSEHVYLWEGNRKKEGGRGGGRSWRRSMIQPHLHHAGGKIWTLGFCFPSTLCLQLHRSQKTTYTEFAALRAAK